MIEKLEGVTVEELQEMLKLAQIRIDSINRLEQAMAYKDEGSFLEFLITPAIEELLKQLDIARIHYSTAVDNYTQVLEKKAAST